MYQDNPYTNFKNKLEARTIQPSGAAWGRIQSQIKAKPKPRSAHMKFFWAAASLLAIIAASTLLLQNARNIQTASPIASAIQAGEGFQLDPSPVSISQEAEKTNVVIKDRPIHEKVESVGKTDQQLTASQATNTAQPAIHPLPEVINDTPARNQKEMVAYDNLAAAEADLLLADAQKELALKKKKNIVKHAKATVLLDEVENDLQKNKTFKSKVYDEVENRLNKIKTVFSDR
ncbi:hypothetical protein ACFSPU_07035 [Haoranjiania flava]|uniref:Uncharacterized protein n=1 Tax=Haoranjiania flava TaxID=1856322 RepID=A0AAE3IN14_9BACT|nr:hypothetical protein [Haoranjiania flava]MCU7694070.1 hypothetical protein [Haoranjiania flava]